MITSEKNLKITIIRVIGTLFIPIPLNLLIYQCFWFTKRIGDEGSVIGAIPWVSYLYETLR